MTISVLLDSALYFEELAYQTWHDTGECTPDATYFFRRAEALRGKAKALKLAHRQARHDAIEANHKRIAAGRSVPFIVINRNCSGWHPEQYEPNPGYGVDGYPLRYYESEYPDADKRYEYHRITYANMTEAEARALYQVNAPTGQGEIVSVIFSEWENVPGLYVNKGYPGAIFPAAMERAA